MRNCYLIQTYKNPQQIYRLVHTIKISSPDSIIILRHNPIYCNLDASMLKQYSDIHFFNAATAKGDFSVLGEYLLTIDWVLKNNLEFEWFINLTGQDYLTQPISKLESLLSTTDYDAYLEYFKVFSKETSWTIKKGHDRYCYKYQKALAKLPTQFLFLLKPLKIINYLQFFWRIHFLDTLMVGRKVKNPFNKDFTCYGGSYFCVLSRKCIKYIHEFALAHPDIIEHYKHVINPDESFFQTVLVNSQLFKLCKEHKHYIDFLNSRHGSPAILTKKDYQFFKDKKYYFARKFDINIDSSILDILDEVIL
jgi:Core-2/I-Branching enzyme